MPATFTLHWQCASRLSGEDAWRLAEAFHSWTFDVLKRLDPATSDLIHAARRKPFTLGLPRLDGQGNCTARMGLLEDGLIGFFQAALQQSSGMEAVLAGKSLCFAGATAMVATYQELWAEARFSAEFLLEYQSATAFRLQQGSHLYPEPRMVFNSLASRWNLFNPDDAAPADLLDLVDRHVWLTAYDLHTEAILLAGGRQSGFVGTALYEVKRVNSLNSSHKRQMAALLLYAPFAGIGIKTALGMGSVILKLPATRGSRP